MHNFSSEEIKKFSGDQTIWWDREGNFKPLHDINPLRLGFITTHVSLSNKRVVDVGCGGGILSESLANLATHVTGIDLNRHAIEAAREHNTFDNLSYECVSTATQVKNGHRYEVVTCMELLEHVPHPGSLIADCANLVTTGGHLFFSTINRTLRAYVKIVLGGEYLFKILPKGTHDYGKFIKPSELACWCRACGLEITDIRGMGYSPVTRRYYLSERPDTNYLIHAVKT